MKRNHVFLAALGLFFAAAAAQPSLSDIDSLLADSLDRAYSGNVCVMVMHGDSLVYYRAIGSYDSASAGQIASGSKTFSGLLMLRLAQEGLFSLDDSIGKFIPYAAAMGKGSSTIRQNFSHTAGWDGSAGDAYLSRPLMTLETCVDSIIAFDPLIYTPGDSFKYTGVSMQVAGRCAEVAAGRSWNQLFSAYLKTPLGLNRTTYCTASPINPRIAGGVCSSPIDMLKLARLILDDGMAGSTRIIDSAVMQEMWKDQTHHAPQIASPYPFNPPFNNPYSADTIYYGIGDWLDIYNPVTGMQEQVSGAGAFGTRFWANRCNNTCGVIFTMTVLLRNFNTTSRIMDIVNSVYPPDCGSAAAAKAGSLQTGAGVRVSLGPNPLTASTIIRIEGAACLPSPSVKIFDMAGRRVAEVRGSSAGWERGLVWDAAGLPTGVYTVFVMAPGAAAGVRAVVIK